MSVVHDPNVIAIADSVKEILERLVRLYDIPNELPDTVYAAITNSYSKGYYNGQEVLHARN